MLQPVEEDGLAVASGRRASCRVYSDEGFIICVFPEDKEHFMAHIAAGNGIPPPIK